MSHVPLLKDLYAKFAAGDIPAVLAAFAADIVWHQAESNPYTPKGEAWHGPQQVLEQLFVRLGADWHEFGVKPQRYHDAGECVVMEGRYSGTHRDSGKRLDAQVCHVWTVRDGKLARFQQYVDTAQLRDVMQA